MSQLSGIRFGAAIENAAQSHGLSPVLLAAVAAQETGGPGSNSGNNVTGDGGHGHGVFQIDDRWHDFASTSAAMDPAQNANYAASLLQANLKATGGDVRGALSMYNAGSPTATGTTTTWADGRTLGYADSVLRHAQDISQTGGASLAASLHAGLGDDSASIGGLASAAGLTYPSSGGIQASSAATSSSGAPAGALAMSSPSTQYDATFHSFSSEQSAGASAASDADKMTGSIVDIDSSVFSDAASDD